MTNNQGSYKPHSRHSSRDDGDGQWGQQALFPPPPPPPPRDKRTNETIKAALESSGVPLTPEAVSQLTQTFLKLRGGSMDAGTPTTATYLPPPPPRPPPFQHPTAPLSPATTHSETSPTMPNRTLYTPPSPGPAPTEPRTARPPDTPPSPQQREPSPDESEDDMPPSGASVNSDAGRPKGPPRLSTATEETTLEKIWGPLFDSNGAATPRLKQFLRGLAVHIVRVILPCCSTESAKLTVTNRLRTMSRGTA
jgi:hypothetical protein